MRLTQIKLAGFKSFVDPTTIPTPSQMVGVVGPNGCGKSNIIDAVRWVLGESRASELRGESMQDVIFNGSGNRKPAARASVELVFDNSEGRATGQWGTYTEISVGRVLTRDGASSYYINNQQVRRRDIHDIFLGTGLGSRGYAIIGQGMINRLIEARPEELRVYLEEAAGVSRYKERRRETENRLKDTRENLLRLEDIMSELTTQLERLQQQAEVAQRYKNWQEEGELKQHLLWLQREQSARNDQHSKALAIENAQKEVEAAVAALRKTEADTEQLRQLHYASGDAVHQAQAEMYEVGAQASSLEAEIRHLQDAKQRMQSRHGQLDGQQQEWAQQQRYTEEQLDELREQLEEAAATIIEAEASSEYAQQYLPDLEEQVHALFEQRETQRQQLTSIEQRLALGQQASQDLQRQRQQYSMRLERLVQERAELTLPEDDALEHLQSQSTQFETQLHAAQANLAKLEAEQPALEQARAQAQKRVQQKQNERQKLDARLQALEQLQIELQQQEGLGEWLRNAALAGLPRLWQQLNIREGWETACEAVLKDRLAAIAVDDFQAFTQLQQLPPAKVSAYTLPEPGVVDEADADALIHQLRLRNPALQSLLAQWLQGVRCVESIDVALQQLGQLSPGEILVCPAGHIVEAHCVRFYAPDDAQAGVLARQQEIDNLQKQLKALNLEEEQLATASAQAHQEWAAISEALPTARHRVHELTHSLHTVQVELARQQQQAQQGHERFERIGFEQQEIEQNIENLAVEHEEKLAQLELLHDQLIEIQAEFDSLRQRSDEVNAQLNEARQQLRDKERVVQEARHAERLLQARFEELSRTQRVAQEQYKRAQEELVNLQGELSEVDADAVQASLQAALELRTEKEEQLALVRARLDAVAHELREKESAKSELEKKIEPLRQAVTDLQLQEQASRISVEQYTEMLDQRQVDRQALRAFLAEQPEQWQRLGWLQSEVQRIARQVEALGAVNLAALEELNTATERQQYLQNQHDDLSDAIETLEDAIRTIDKEIRELLLGTFNTVNGHFGELFPRLFGGGEAKLILTGDEVLDAGVQVMAQPPGKRNSTIHLLSGGEKALTATALVFALFKLNPAPFCLLDEVDAPLDDANTERYAKLVSSMSDQTQFLFISHNKIAMHMAQQLIGVTMQEQGVSRIVAVDVESAMQMADA